MNEYFNSNTVLREDMEFISESFRDWDIFNNKTILITGANGQIATFLTYAFIYKIVRKDIDTKLIVSSRNIKALKEKFKYFSSIEKIVFLEWDVAKPLEIDEQVDFIYHFAGNASPHFIKTDPVGILSANILGAFSVCEFARRYDNCRIVYASTREVYGNNSSEDSLTETSFGSLDPLEPRSCYPESKRAAEAIFEAYNRQFGINYAILRIAHCYGPGMKLAGDGRVMSDFINNAVNKQDILLNSDGSALRSFIYVSDVVTAILQISTQTGSDAWNLSNETEEISVLDLAGVIAEESEKIRVIVNLKKKDQLVYTSYKRKPLDCSKLLKLGWKPEVSLKQGLLKTLHSFRNN